jgi:uncharacterized phage protein (TIGR02218 family)
MKTASSALRAILASRVFAYADLYTFTLIGGGVLRYTSYDVDVAFNGHTWSAGGTTGPFLDRTDNKAKCHWKVGVEVDQLVFDVLPGQALVNGQPFLSAVLQGAFDGAELELDRAYFQAPPAAGQAVSIPLATGVLILFAGRVAEVDCGRSIATFNVNSHLELLNQNLPRNVFQASCLNTLGDAACTVDVNLFKAPSSALAGSTVSTLIANVSGSPAGCYDQGKVTFTSGALSGLSRTVKQASFGSPGTVTLLNPFPVAPAPGDAFTIFFGCDRTLGPNGCPKFNNNPNFRGFPFVPVPETAV